MARETASERELKASVWNKTGGVCWYCGVQTVRPTNYTMDHVVPVRDGGQDTYENLVPCCRSCNCTKRHKSVEEFRELLAVRRGERFSDAQLDYLDRCGIALPKPPHHQFWFEIGDEEE